MYCYNVQPGIDIDYATGDSKVSETNTVNNNANTAENVTSDYVLNTNCCQYADEVGLNPDRELFEANAQYVRTALVANNAVFDDFYNRSCYLLLSLRCYFGCCGI